MPNGGFAALKHPAKWGFGCEIGSFYASQPFQSCKTPCELGFWLRNLAFSCFGASQPFRSYEIRVTVLQNGTRVPKVASQLRKFSQRGACGCELVSQQSVDFVEAAKSRRPLFFHFSCSKRFSFNFFAIPLDFDHPKTYITS